MPTHCQYTNVHNAVPASDRQAEGGRPALEEGAQLAQLDTMCYLINAGADVEATSDQGLTISECADQSAMDNYPAKV